MSRKKSNSLYLSVLKSFRYPDLEDDERNLLALKLILWLTDDSKRRFTSVYDLEDLKKYNIDPEQLPTLQKAYYSFSSIPMDGFETFFYRGQENFDLLDLMLGSENDAEILRNSPPLSTLERRMLLYFQRFHRVYDTTSFNGYNETSARSLIDPVLLESVEIINSTSPDYSRLLIAQEPSIKYANTVGGNIDYCLLYKHERIEEPIILAVVEAKKLKDGRPQNRTLLDSEQFLYERLPQVFGELSACILYNTRVFERNDLSDLSDTLPLYGFLTNGPNWVVSQFDLNRIEAREDGTIHPAPFVFTNAMRYSGILEEGSITTGITIKDYRKEIERVDRKIKRLEERIEDNEAETVAHYDKAREFVDNSLTVYPGNEGVRDVVFNFVTSSTDDITAGERYKKFNVGSFVTKFKDATTRGAKEGVLVDLLSHLFDEGWVNSPEGKSRMIQYLRGLYVKIEKADKKDASLKKKMFPLKQKKERLQWLMNHRIKYREYAGEKSNYYAFGGLGSIGDLIMAISRIMYDAKGELDSYLESFSNAKEIVETALSQEKDAKSERV